jgi:hypothetical protein
MRSARRLHPTEFMEQKALFDWAAIAERYYPELCMMFHVPNGGSRNQIEAKHLKISGVKSGVPDIFLPVPRGNVHGLWIEMKSETGTLSGQQRSWMTALREYGYSVAICFSAEEAMQIIKLYLKGKDEPSS